MKRQKITISELPIGSRILYRSRENWRTAAIARCDEEIVTLTVCSPTGRTYRLRRKKNSEVFFEGSLVILKADGYQGESWRDNYGEYDNRW